MKRRDFFKFGGLLSVGSILSNGGIRHLNDFNLSFNKSKKAKNLIYMVSDGMSIGTLNMADIYLSRNTGKGSNWIDLYRNAKTSRGLMDMASASSIVTDSSAASSSWGSGHRVKNGSINYSTSGESLVTLWSKYKKAGKKTGCVTTVPVTHATPAGFCVSAQSRNSQEDIALKYLDSRFDLFLGGGDKFFSSTKRSDKKDMYAEFKKAGYYIAKNKTELENAPSNTQLLGVFADDALPYSVDYHAYPDTKDKVPTLAEMTKAAIKNLNTHKQGFVMQVEAGKVDWAAHANDLSALVFDQIAFDEAIKVAIEFAENDKNTLVVICTDHGNANPGIIYGPKANDQFDNLSHFTISNDLLLQSITKDQSVDEVRGLIKTLQNLELTNAEVESLLAYYKDLPKENQGIYNYKNLPFALFAEIQKKHTSVGWISMDHSADYVEVTMFGPGSGLLTPFIKNTNMHHLVLNALGIDSKPT